jgi:cytochrome c-type biogenesis protein CcsB
MNIIKFLFSGTFMGMLLIVFAVSMGYATFIENDFDSVTAKVLVYNAWWFELLMVLMAVNFSGMIFTRKLYRKSKINILIMHLSLIVIIIGAGITRYVGWEGMMHIRNGQETNQYTSSNTFFYAEVTDGTESAVLEKEIMLSPVRRNFYREQTELGGKEVEVKALRYIPNAAKIAHEDENGVPVIDIVVSGHGGRSSILVEWNSTVVHNGITWAFGGAGMPGNINFQYENNTLSIGATEDIVATGGGDTLPAGSFHPASPMQIYLFESLQFLVRDVKPRARIDYVSLEENQRGTNMLETLVRVDQTEQRVMLEGGNNRVGKTEEVTLNGVHFRMSAGAQVWVLPFRLRLNKFILERYPGSSSPSSFASDITLIDPDKGLEKPYRIFMNNILAYEGYRFYQSSYDQDEQGTVLSVNHDYWGTMVTYIGYFLLFASLIAAFFTRKTRFAMLLQRIREVHAERKRIFSAAVLFLMVSGGAEVLADNGEVSAPVVGREHAAQFGRLLVQSRDGRIMPVNTLSNTLLMKVYKKSAYNGLTPDQVLLSMTAFPEAWRRVPLIKVGHEDLQEQVGIDGQYASVLDFFDGNNNYKFRDKVDAVYKKSPSLRTPYDKELVYVDERLNVAFMILRGTLLKIFPLPGDPNDRWVFPMEYAMYLQESQGDGPAPRFSEYQQALSEAVSGGNYNVAGTLLDRIDSAQRAVGGDIIPPQTRTSMEVFYNKAMIFKRLFPFYMIFGCLLIGIFLLNLFKPSWSFEKLKVGITVLIFIAFLVQTFGLGLRWYISGHEPWSNGYESMIYIAWAAVLAGFLFRRQSAATMGVTALLAGITLLTAHMSWMNPEITNLVPVLKSYWLTIHVATITASYGFFGLSAMMGFLNLCIMIFRNKRNMGRINLALRETTYIIELSMMIGLVLLVIGNFLGGVWANESWGRYWGWDPKETWSLVTIIVYTFVLHMRLIPGMKSFFSTNFGAIVGLGSVLMTYFGVNYYLSGLHSYAQGDPVPIPQGLYYSVAFILIVSILAYWNQTRLGKVLPGTAMIDEEDTV